MQQSLQSLIGVGLYTPSEAGRLLGLDPRRISRWLVGHEANGVRYEPLWQPQVDLAEGGFGLGFRDLQEVRVASAFIAKGLSAQRVRRAIALARDLTAEERPLSTRRFRTDGRSVFLQVVEESGGVTLIDLFRGQFAFGEIMERSLSNLDYDSDGTPKRWWPLGRAAAIVLDPARSFGQPIEAETSVPVAALVAAVAAEGSVEAAAALWDVPSRAVQRALAFERYFDVQQAA